MKKILILEDDRISGQLIKIYLKDINAKISLVTDDKEFKNEIEGQEFDLLLLDISIPGDLDGFDLMEFYLKEKENIPIIIIISAFIDKKTEALQRGATDFLEKPFLQKNLINKINKYLK